MTPITLGIRNRTKPHVFKARMRPPRGFDSHRPLHFSLSGVFLRRSRTRRSSRSSFHSRLIYSVDRPVGRARLSEAPASGQLDSRAALIDHLSSEEIT